MVGKRIRRWIQHSWRAKIGRNVVRYNRINTHDTVIRRLAN
jgi:hypothetical protein